MLKDELESKVKECEAKIVDALQELFNQTGLIPNAVSFEPLDVTTFGNDRLEVLISNCVVSAST